MCGESRGGGVVWTGRCLGDARVAVRRWGGEESREGGVQCGGGGRRSAREWGGGKVGGDPEAREFGDEFGGRKGEKKELGV